MDPVHTNPCDARAVCERIFLLQSCLSVNSHPTYPSFPRLPLMPSARTVARCSALQKVALDRHRRRSLTIPMTLRSAQVSFPTVIPTCHASHSTSISSVKFLSRPRQQSPQVILDFTRSSSYTTTLNFSDTLFIRHTLPYICPRSHFMSRSTSNCAAGRAPRREGRRSSLSGGAPAWAPKAIVNSTSDKSAKRRPSLGGGLPPWAPKHGDTKENDDDMAVGPGESGGGRSRRPSLGGGMPSWAPTNSGGSAAGADSSSKGGRRPSLSGGMPAWAPKAPPVSATARGDTAEDVRVSDERAGESAAGASSSPVLPEWIAMATRASVGSVRSFLVSKTSLA